MPFSIDISPLRGEKALENLIEIRRNTQAKIPIFDCSWNVHEVFMKSSDFMPKSIEVGPIKLTFSQFFINITTVQTIHLRVG